MILAGQISQRGSKYHIAYKKYINAESITYRLVYVNNMKINMTYLTFARPYCLRKKLLSFISVSETASINLPAVLQKNIVMKITNNKQGHIIRLCKSAFDK